MRVTSDMMMRGMLKNLSRNLAKIDRYNNQLGTGKRILKPSDDPASTTLQMGLRSELRKIKQYVENVQSGITWLENTDVALREVGDVIQRLRDLAGQGSTSTLAQDSRDAIAEEVNELIDHLVQVGNSRVGDRFIFAGTRTTAPPMVKQLGADGRIESVTYEGDTGTVSVEVASGVAIEMNIPGSTIFSAVFDAAINLRDKLLAGDLTAVGGSCLSDLDNATQVVLQHRAIVGAKLNRFELTESRLGDIEANTKTLLSEVEDIDVAELILNLRMQEVVYEASLNVGSKVIQPSLLNFMK